MSKVIIGLIGLKGSGKSTSYSIINRLIGGNANECMLAKKLKESCSLAFDIPFDHFEDPSIKEALLENPPILNMSHMMTMVKHLDGMDLLNTENTAHLMSLVGMVMESPRKMAQISGTEVLRSLDPDIHASKIELIDGVNVVTDMRFQNEFDFFHRKNDFKFIPLYISRKSAEDLVNESSHISERSVLGLAKLATVIDNNGSRESLEDQLLKVLKENNLIKE